MAESDSAAYARLHNVQWASFVKQVAPAIHDFYMSVYGGVSGKTLLDLCCGTGQLTAYFLGQGWRVS